MIMAKKELKMEIKVKYGTFKKFSEEIGMHYQSISNLCNGKSGTILVNAEKICHFLKCDFDDVFEVLPDERGYDIGLYATKDFSRWMHIRNIDVSGLSELSGFTKDHIYKIIGRRTGVRGQTAKVIADVLCVDVEQIFEYVEVD